MIDVVMRAVLRRGRGWTSTGLERADAEFHETRAQRFTRVDFHPCDPPDRKPAQAGRERLMTVVRISL
jgi:hypothetical protein